MLFGKTKTSEAPAPEASSGAPVFDVSDADFEQRVLMASMERPVIVDFWAPWCGPCKQLGPALEKAVTAAGGAVLMAKVNIDQNPGLAQALQVQSIPTIYAFFQGRPVDGFQGAVPDSQIKAFIDKLVHLSKQAAPDAIDIPESLKAAALALSENNFQGAQSLYAQILNQDPKNAQAYVGLVRTLIAAGAVDEARQLVATAPPEIAKNPVFSEARSALELAESKPVESNMVLLEKLAKNPADHQARYDLALSEFTAGRKEEAIDQLLEIIARKRDWNEDAARKQMIRFFEALGPSDPLTLQGRRRLSSLLFS